MRTRAAAWLAALLTIGAAAGPAGAAQTFLDATFNHATIDAPIGTRGAPYGEPSWIHSNVSAIVRATPFATPCLELSDTDPVQAGMAGFLLMGGVEVSQGTVSIALDLWFDEIGPGHEFLVRVTTYEYMKKLTELYFRADGTIEVSDENGLVGRAGSYQTGRPFPILIGYDLDAHTYSLWFDGDLAVSHEASGVYTGGVWAVMIGPQPNSVPSSKLWLDRLRVTDGEPNTPVETTTWGAIKSLFR